MDVGEQQALEALEELQALLVETPEERVKRLEATIVQLQIQVVQMTQMQQSN